VLKSLPFPNLQTVEQYAKNYKSKKAYLYKRLMNFKMATPIQFIIDDEGNKKSVIVPFEQWEELNQRYEKLNNKVQILTGLQEAMKEVEHARRTGKKLQYLTDFLDESRD